MRLCRFYRFACRSSKKILIPKKKYTTKNGSVLQLPPHMPSRVVVFPLPPPSTSFHPPPSLPVVFLQNPPPFPSLPHCPFYPTVVSPSPLPPPPPTPSSTIPKPPPLVNLPCSCIRLVTAPSPFPFSFFYSPAIPKKIGSSKKIASFLREALCRSEDPSPFPSPPLPSPPITHQRACAALLCFLLVLAQPGSPFTPCPSQPTNQPTNLMISFEEK